MEVESLVMELKKLAVDNDVSGIESALRRLTTSEDIQSADVSDSLLLELLVHNTPTINLLVSKSIAEITKSAEKRTSFSNNDVLEKLIELLVGSREIPLTIQLCRALNNIFYSNDDARNIIFHLDGGKSLLDLFDIPNSAVSSEDLELFGKVRSGVVSNYLMGNEELSQKAIELGIIDKMKLRMEESPEDLGHLLPVFSILAEQVSDLVFQPEIFKTFTNILKTSRNSDVIEACLELLVYQLESDDVKLILAKEGICEHIFTSIDDFKTCSGSAETKSLVKLACDLIVLILTGDEAMHLLDKSPLLSYMKSWLESDDFDLLTTSVLALGNFARTDEHCIRMVQENLHLKLIEILSKNNGADADVRLQHALLSAIRNLVIPKQNKIAVIKAGLTDTILPMLETHQPPVVFKLLGTLRMLVDGQSELAMKFLGNQKLIEQLVEWAKKTPDMVGVNSEASRLMAWLIKNAYRTGVNQPMPEPLKLFVGINGTIEILVNMLLSAHLVMQNEALLSLIIISGNLEQDSQLSKALIAANLGQNLVDFIQRISENERTTNEIIENLNSLVIVLQRDEDVKKHLSQHNIDEKLKIAPKMEELATL